MTPTDTDLPPQGEPDAAFCRWCNNDRYRARKGALVCKSCDHWEDHK